MTFIVAQGAIDDKVVYESTDIALRVQKSFPDNVGVQLSTLTRALCVLAHYHGVDEDSLLDNVSSMLLHIDSTTIQE